MYFAPDAALIYFYIFILLIFQTVICAAIRRTAVREAGTSYHHGAQVRAPWNPTNITALWYRRVSGALIWDPLCRKMSTSQCWNKRPPPSFFSCLKSLFEAWCFYDLLLFLWFMYFLNVYYCLMLWEHPLDGYGGKILPSVSVILIQEGSSFYGTFLEHPYKAVFVCCIFVQ